MKQNLTCSIMSMVCVVMTVTVGVAGEEGTPTMAGLLAGVKHVEIRSNKEVGGYIVTLLTDSDFEQMQQGMATAEEEWASLKKKIQNLNESLTKLGAGNREGQAAVQQELRHAVARQVSFWSEEDRARYLRTSSVVSVSDELLIVKKMTSGRKNAIPFRHISSILLTGEGKAEANGVASK